MNDCTCPSRGESPHSIDCFSGIELGGVAEMSEEFGVPRTTASMWDDPERRRTNGFPKPIARLAMGPVFDMAEVRAWWQSKALARAGESREIVESS